MSGRSRSDSSGSSSSSSSSSGSSGSSGGDRPPAQRATTGGDSRRLHPGTKPTKRSSLSTTSSTAAPATPAPLTASAVLPVSASMSASASVSSSSSTASPATSRKKSSSSSKSGSSKRHHHHHHHRQQSVSSSSSSSSSPSSSAAPSPRESQEDLLRHRRRHSSKSSSSSGGGSRHGSRAGILRGASIDMLPVQRTAMSQQLDECMQSIAQLQENAERMSVEGRHRDSLLRDAEARYLTIERTSKEQRERLRKLLESVDTLLLPYCPPPAASPINKQYHAELTRFRAALAAEVTPPEKSPQDDAPEKLATPNLSELLQQVQNSSGELLDHKRKVLRTQQTFEALTSLLQSALQLETSSAASTAPPSPSSASTSTKPAHPPTLVASAASSAATSSAALNPIQQTNKPTAPPPPPLLGQSSFVGTPLEEEVLPP